MILYSIRRKADVKFFQSMWSGNAVPRWSEQPTFWKQSETIWKHLKRLCSDPKFEDKKVNGITSQLDYWYRTCRWVNFDADLLKGYEVVETNVNILGEKRTNAEDFVTVKKMEQMHV